jgi:hypothetical protein
MLCKGEAKTRGEFLASMIGGGGWFAGTLVVGWIVPCMTTGEVIENVEEVGLGDIE